jgi:hypothetical protein
MGELKDCMGELKDWTGETTMTDLWKFNGGVKPKFWFGDRVEHPQYKVGVVLGIEWRQKDCAVAFELDGWFYLVGYPHLGRLALHSEIALKDIVQTEGEKCLGF